MRYRSLINQNEHEFTKGLSLPLARIPARAACIPAGAAAAGPARSPRSDVKPLSVDPSARKRTEPLTSILLFWRVVLVVLIWHQKRASSIRCGYSGSSTGVWLLMIAAIFCLTRPPIYQKLPRELTHPPKKNYAQLKHLRNASTTHPLYCQELLVHNQVILRGPFDFQHHLALGRILTRLQPAVQQAAALLQIAIEHSHHLRARGLICMVIHVPSHSHVDLAAIRRIDQADVHTALCIALQNGILVQPNTPFPPKKHKSYHQSILKNK